MIRVCKKCQVEKELNEYYLKKDGKPNSLYCKICYNEKISDYNKEACRKYYQYNKEELYQKHKEWIKNNKEDIKEYRKKYYQENKDEVLLKNKQYKLDNPDKILKIREEYYIKNKEDMCLKIRLKYQESDKIKETKRNYITKRRSEDPIFKLTMNIRCLIKNSFKRIFTKKSKKTIDILGCTFEEFKIYLESKFDENMTFENYGEYWEIDHIIPISSVKSEEDVIKLNHYTNLQPLYWRDNLEKSNKI